MPVLPALVIATDTVEPDAFYADSLYEPANPPGTLEMLNGGLDADNWYGTVGSVPVWACQSGAFTAGLYNGFTRWEFAYARQLSYTASSGERHQIVHAGLSATYWLPWNASVICLWWQAMFSHHCGYWTVATPSVEWWEIHTRLDGALIVGSDSRLPHGIVSIGTLATPSGDDMDEDRFRYVCKIVQRSGMSGTLGPHKIRVTLWARLRGDYDADKANVITRAGGVGVVAFR